MRPSTPFAIALATLAIGHADPAFAPAGQAPGARVVSNAARPRRIGVHGSRGGRSSSIARAALGVILLIGAPAPAASAQTIDADRPGVLYAGSVLPAGRLQLEVGGFEVTRVADSTERSTLLNFPTVVRVGLGRQLEIQVGHTLVNRLTTVAAGRSQRETGLGDLALGLKFARAASGARPGIVIAGGAVLPTGERPFSSEDPQLGVQGQALWSIGRGGSLGVLGGYARTAREGPDAANATLAVSIAAPFGHAWSAYVEAAALPIFDAGPTVAFVGGGITRIVGQRMQLDLFLNRGLTSASMDWTVGGGVAVRF